MSGWTQAEAIALCRQIEEVCPAFGCHVALTGGVLYKIGERKDLDILFYRIRQQSAIEVDRLFNELGKVVGIERTTWSSGFCIKATWRGRKIDCFFPEAEPGEYPTDVVPPPSEPEPEFAPPAGPEDIEF